MPDGLSYRRNHSLLLLQKLLSSKPGSSPFTLLLDSLEQSSKPLVKEFIARAKTNRAKTVFLAFETLQAPPGIDVFIRGRGKNAGALQMEITRTLPKDQATLVIIDTIHPLVSIASSSNPPMPFAALLTSFSSPTSCLLATYHTDIPLSDPTTHYGPYVPDSLSLAKYLATTLITVYALSHTLAAHRAAARSMAAPTFGLEEDVEGLLMGLGANGGRRGFEVAAEGLDASPESSHGVVLELEHRRKSGRGVSEMFFLPTATSPTQNTSLTPTKCILLDDHPLFALPKDLESSEGGDPTAEATTFSLNLTEKQRRDREGVVLPYFDAQKSGGGPGEGGRILYQMGAEDAGDFDSEEDEI